MFTREARRTYVRTREIRSQCTTKNRAASKRAMKRSARRLERRAGRRESAAELERYCVEMLPSEPIRTHVLRALPGEFEIGIDVEFDDEYFDRGAA